MMAAADIAYCERLLREADRDRYVADLYAPEDRRDDLFALHAFDVEIARVADRVNEALAGEIRLQWWSDALSGEGHGAVRSNPVAAALLETIARHDLPASRLQQLIDAHRSDLYADPVANLTELSAYAQATAGTMLALSARLLDPSAVLAESAIAATAEALVIARLLFQLPRLAAHGRIFFPGDILDSFGVDRGDILAGRGNSALRGAVQALVARGRQQLATARLGSLPAPLRPAFLPLALVESDLSVAERAQDPFAPSRPSPWRRQWRLWRASRRGF
jgi:phytoene synthase